MVSGAGITHSFSLACGLSVAGLSSVAKRYYVSDTYVSKTIFSVSEFANVVNGGAKVISGETLLLGNLGLGLRLTVNYGGKTRRLLFDTGP